MLIEIIKAKIYATNCPDKTTENYAMLDYESYRKFVKEISAN